MEKIRIFIVDDSIAARGMLTRMLSSEEDFEVVGEAGTGQGSVIMLEDVNPNVVMLETAVGGGMKINDIVKEMKKAMPEIKIILCTDSSSTEKVIPAAEVGADDFVSKPYKKETIVRAIRECVKI